jgi:cytochrome c-type biogenesis protein CcmH/NrfG
MDLSRLNVALQERALSDAQVHALLSRVAAMTGAWPRARAEAQVAMALDAHEVLAQEQHVVTQEAPEARLAASRQVTQENGKDPAGWLLLGLALPPGDPERGQALALAVELDPHSAMALTELAAHRCAEARCPEGVPLAERAAELSPGNARVLAGTAAVQLQAGLCAQAVASQQRALEVLPARAPPALRKQLQTRLSAYQRCR